MLVFARVLAIELLREKEAYARYPEEARAFDLSGLMSNGIVVLCNRWILMALTRLRIRFLK